MVNLWWNSCRGSQEVGPTNFVGYENLNSEAQVVALIKEGERVETASAGENVEIILDTTSFYAEMGGEVGDTGTIFSNAGVVAEVNDTKLLKKV